MQGRKPSGNKPLVEFPVKITSSQFETMSKNPYKGNAGILVRLLLDEFLSLKHPYLNKRFNEIVFKKKQESILRKNGAIK